MCDPDRVDVVRVHMMVKILSSVYDDEGVDGGGGYEHLDDDDGGSVDDAL